MNELNSTRLNPVFRLFGLMIGLIFGTIQYSTAQPIPSCACNGTIQVSVGSDCLAVISARDLLTDDATCDGFDNANVILMDQNGTIITQGVGSATLYGYHYINRTIIGKATTQDGANSCWTQINVEDKLGPTWLGENPDTLVVTCPAIAEFEPIAIDNCTRATVYQIGEEVIINNCNNSIFAGPDTLKMIERTYGAVDAYGNQAIVPFKVVFWVVKIGLDDLIGVENAELECDGNWAKIPSGPYAGHPSPTPIGIQPGTGVPSLHAWMPATRGAGSVDINPVNGNLRLSGGTDTGTLAGLGAEVCFTATEDGIISFDWSASMQGSTPPDGNFNGDHAKYGIEGVYTNLTVGGSGSGATPQSGHVSGISISEGEQFCFRVRTDNNLRWTELMVSNFSGPIADALPLNPEVCELCNVIVSFTDQVIPQTCCEDHCGELIVRTWKIIEWSACSNSIKELVQLIEIYDTKGPNISGLLNEYQATTNGFTCEAVYKLPKPVLTDNCSENLYYSVTYPGGILNNLKVNGSDNYVSLPQGCNVVTYTAYDGCKNKTENSILVFVEDNTPPVPICIHHTAVGLTSNGQAWIHASSFDDLSYDDCGISQTLVRRMTPPDCEPCPAPNFPGFRLLGEYQAPGTSKPHYYYVSQAPISAKSALKMAEGMGGYVVAIDNAEEDEWVYNQVNSWGGSYPYLIGLKKRNSSNSYDWVNGQTSTYTNWHSGHDAPNHTLGEYVFASSYYSGKWDDFNLVNCEDSNIHYVVEIEDPCGFDSKALFCCSDVPTPQTVVFRVIDNSGNYNDCMVEVTVQDKLPPSIACPADQTVNCDSYFDVNNLRATFGWPTAYDNCDNIVITTDSIVDLSVCRIGTITRHFTATDPGGRQVSCTQTITVRGNNNFNMTAERWPADFIAEGCQNPNDPAFGPEFTGYPDISADNICSLPAVAYEDQVFYFNNAGGDACFKILRHWSVIDCCQFVETSGGGLGYKEWKHTQTIKVFDNEKPQIVSGCEPQSICTYDPNCLGGYIELTASATDNCTEQLYYRYKVYLNNSSSFDQGYSKEGLASVIEGGVNVANASDTYPIGTHRIEWTFEDRCGNFSTCSTTFTINSCKAPTPYCINGLATSLMKMGDGGMVEVWASDFDLGSYHPCGSEVFLSFAPITLDANGNPVLVSGKVFTCDNLGRQDINIYAGVITSTGEVIQDYCSTFIDIQDNLGVCGTGDLVAGGRIANQDNVPVEGVNVDFVGSERNVVTTEDGEYSFNNILAGGNYTIAPSKTDDYMNGISTLDLLHIQRHILGIQELDNPYKLIAADVNNDKNISVSDISELRKLILGLVDSFSNNDSWKIFVKAYQFNDGLAAQNENLPLVFDIENMQTNQNVDFVAVKIGDIDNDAIANANETRLQTRSSNNLNLAVENQKMNSGTPSEVPVYVTERTELAGFQFTIHFDADRFNLVSVNSTLLGITDNNFGFRYLADGIITVSYNREVPFTLEKGESLINLTLQPKSTTTLDDALSISSEVTKAEAYDYNLRLMNVDLNVEDRAIDGIVLLQNTPNPFKSITTIGFELPEAADATFTIYDVTGRTVKVIKNTYRKGYNSIEINKDELGIAGVLYYTLESGDFKATKKMVVIE